MFEKFSPQALRDAIEIELKKTDDAKMASMIAIKRLEKDPQFYEKKLENEKIKFIKQFNPKTQIFEYKRISK